MSLNRKPSRVFYGWWIVGACFLIAVYIGGAIFDGFTAFFEPIANEFGWSYTQISLAVSLRSLEAGLLALLSGVLVDSWGPRRLMFSGAIITCLALILLSRTTSLIMFYGAFALMTVGVRVCVGVVPVAAVANWFRRRVGLAIGITASGVGFGGLLIPVIVRLIDIYEWRTTMVILALGMLVIVLPLSLLVRHKPEQYGYLPDGEVKGVGIADKSLVPAQTVEVEIGARQALKSRVFWHIALTLLFLHISADAVLTHVMPYLSSIGVARSISSLVTSAFLLLSVSGRLGFGWLADKFDKRRVTAGALVMASLGLLCFEYVATLGTWLLVPFIIFFGISFGANVPLRVSLLREYFGRSNFGTILGVLSGIIIVGVSAGPPLAGWVFDNWGSYQGIWLVFAGLTIMAMVIVATMPPVSTAIQTVDKA